MRVAVGQEFTEDFAFEVMDGMVQALPRPRDVNTINTADSDKR
jgi:hypothetical protein